MLVQLAIVLCSGFSIWSLSGKRYRLGFAVGLCGQPFWMYTALTEEQWGILLVSVWFTFHQARGLWAHWNIH